MNDSQTGHSELLDAADSGQDEHSSTTRQFSLRFLAGILTLWCVLIALASPTWPNSVPMLVVAAALTVCLLGLGAWLQRHVGARRLLALLSLLGLSVSFFLPAASASPLFRISGSNACWVGLSLPFHLGELEVPGNDRELIVGFVLLVSLVWSSYGSLGAYPALFTACWPRENVLVRICRAGTGATVVGAASVVFAFYGTEDELAGLSALGWGYWLWACSLLGIWLAHAPRRTRSAWLLLAAAIVILALAAFAVQLPVAFAGASPANVAFPTIGSSVLA